MPTTMSKFLYLGLSLEEVIKASTTKPAEVLGKGDEIGTLKIGACGDVTVMKLIEGRFPLVDVEEESRICKKRLIVTKVVRDGEIAF